MDFPGRRFKNGEVIYSEWFGRGGDNAILFAESIDRSGTGQLVIELYTKNADDAGDGTLLQGAGATSVSLTISSAGIGEELVESDGTDGFEELVRLKATCTGGTNDWIYARVFPLVWFDSAD